MKPPNNVGADKDEKMSKILVSERRFLGAVARWAVEQSPYHRPDNLELVLDKLHEQTKDFWKIGQLGFVFFPDRKAVIEFVRDNLRKIPEYNDWNERKNGRQGMGFSGGQSKLHPNTASRE